MGIMVPNPGTLFFIHKGQALPYLTASILQARFTNPGSQIVFLTDQTAETLSGCIVRAATIAPMSKYFSAAARFAEVFQFEGNNAYDYELLNFQRWFLVSEYCEKNALRGPIMVLDSDSFLFTSLESIAPSIKSAMTVVDSVGPQFTFFGGKDAVTKFVDFLMDCFTQPEILETLRKFVKNNSANGVPHLSDMAAFGVYSERELLEDLGLPDRESFMFCENIGSSQGLVMGILGKKIVRRRNQRFFVTKSGRMVGAGGVHLQGGNKTLWPFFVAIPVLFLLLRKEPRLLSQALVQALEKAGRVVFLRTGERSRIALRRFRTQGRLRP